MIARIVGSPRSLPTQSFILPIPNPQFSQIPFLASPYGNLCMFPPLHTHHGDRFSFVWGVADAATVHAHQT